MSDHTTDNSINTGRDLFFYLLLFFTLAITALSAGGVIFQIINHYWPDAVVNSRGQVGGPLRWSVAALLVASPIYFWVSWKIKRDLVKGLTSAVSKTRRVIIYLALFLASAVMIVDVITLVFNFVGGELTGRFLLKVLVILLIGGWISWHYWRCLLAPLNNNQVYKKNFNKAEALFYIIVVLAILTFGFTLAGNPLEQQKLVRDQRRVSDLQQLFYAVQNYYDNATQASLPDNLNEIKSPSYYEWQPLDPLTGQPYVYNKLTDSTFELCADFESANAVNNNLGYISDISWSHPAGHYCFTLTVSTSRIK